MLVFLLPTYFYLLFVNIFSRRKKVIASLAECVILFSFLVLLVTEFFSFFSSLNPKIISVFWAFVCILFAIINYKQKVKYLFRIQVEYGNMAKCLIYIILFCFIITFALSVLSVPGNADSMAYHLPKIKHWIQDGTTVIANMNTHDLREAISPFFSEYLVLHTMLLSGSDYFVNLVQWAAYVLCAVITYGCCRKLEVRRESALVGAVLFITMPIALAESTTTQNDLVGTLYVLIFVFYWIDLIKMEHINGKGALSDIFFCAASIGFAYITKSNACFVMLSFLLILLISRILKKDRISDLFIAASVGFISVFICASVSFIKLYAQYGSIFPFQLTNSVTIGTLKLNFVLLNIFKNICCIIINDYIECFNIILINLGYLLANILHCDLNDARIHFGSIRFEECFDNGYYTCDLGSAPTVIFCMIALLLIFYFYKAKHTKIKIDKGRAFIYASILGTLILLIALRWQPWGMRLLMPAVTMLCICDAILLDSVCLNKSFQIAIVSIITCLCLENGIKTIEANMWRPIDFVVHHKFQDRESMYDVFNTGMENYYYMRDELVNNNCEEIGLIIFDGNEYIIWEILEETGIDLKHVSLDVLIKQASDAGSLPQYIWVDTPYSEEELLSISYEKVDLPLSTNVFSLWKRQDK